MLKTINMGSSSRPSALYFDSANNQLMVGDQGPNMNIQIVIPALKPHRGSFEMKYCGCLFMRIVSLVSEVTFSLENAYLSSLWLQRDSEAEAFEPLHQMPFEPFRMEMVEVVAAEFLIHAAFTLKVIADDQ